MRITRKFTRTHVLLAAGAIALLLVTVIGLAAAGLILAPAPRASLAASGHIRLRDPVVVHFDRAVDLTHVKVLVEPAGKFKLGSHPDRLEITPTPAWQPSTGYRLHLDNVADANHRGTLAGWVATFTTQPDISITAVEASGQKIDSEGPVRLSGQLVVTFGTAMRTSSITVNQDGKALPATALSWSKELLMLTITPQALLPNQTVAFEFGGHPQSRAGDPLQDSLNVKLHVLGLEPSNLSSGIGDDFKTLPPIEVVLENTAEAKPQSGMQAADMAYEYISEYQVTRLTMFYFARPPPTIGPVRSCRLISPLINLAFHGVTMCSGASVNTLHQMFGPPLIPGSIWDFDRGQHFYTSPSRPQPHHVYTDRARAERLRAEWHDIPPPPFTVDPPHPDVARGDPAGDPVIPLQSAAYTYDSGSGLYHRLDHGRPFIDALTNDAVKVKNVILLHADSHDAGFIEDDVGGAHSIAYDVIGSGPAEIYSGGRAIHATWHMGKDTPTYFTDSNNQFIRLNTGLTWVHVIGNGQ